MTVSERENKNMTASERENKNMTANERENKNMTASERENKNKNIKEGYSMKYKRLYHVFFQMFHCHEVIALSCNS